MSEPEFVLLPLHRREFPFFQRQRDAFSDFLHQFDDDWRDMELAESQARFDKELDRVREELHRLDVEPNELAVEQPFVRDHDGNVKMLLRFDCSQYNPEDIQIQLQDKKLKVHAKHVDEAPGRKNLREFWREYELPDVVDPQLLKSHLSQDGLLQIEAPVPAPPEEAPKDILIPIERLESKKEETKPEAEQEKPEGAEAAEQK